MTKCSLILPENLPDNEYCLSKPPTLILEINVLKEYIVIDKAMNDKWQWYLNLKER